MIVNRLRELTGKTLSVKILKLWSRQGNKLIFSEKAAGDSDLAEKVKDQPIGERLTGEVTGVVDFGIFVRVGKVEGLVHISEVSWEKIDNLKSLYNPGDKVEVVVIGVKVAEFHFPLNGFRTIHGKRKSQRSKSAM